MERCNICHAPCSHESVNQCLEAREKKANEGNWIPGTGETPFITRNRYRLLYCWQPSTGKKAYLNLDTDILLSDEEARMALGL